MRTNEERIAAMHKKAGEMKRVRQLRRGLAVRGGSPCGMPRRRDRAGSCASGPGRGDDGQRTYGGHGGQHHFKQRGRRVYRGRDTVPVETSRTEPTDTATGKIVYNATVIFEGNTYTTQKEDIIPAKGHRYGDPTWTWTGVESAKAVFVCDEGDDRQEINPMMKFRPAAEQGGVFLRPRGGFPSASCA